MDDPLRNSDARLIETFRLGLRSVPGRVRLIEDHRYVPDESGIVPGNLIVRSNNWRFEPTVINSTPDTVPRSLGQYDLIGPLGRGGMGVVYKAQHRLLRQFVAIKFIAPNIWGDPQTLARFYREIEAAGRVVHPNLVRAFDAGEIDGHHVLVTEFVDGVTVHELLKTGPLPVEVACEIVRQAALGLAAIHAAKMVHRDLKPANLMLGPDGVVKVLDLGLARSINDFDSELTFSGHLLGTIDFMAPEQSANARAVDARADLYSLGCSLYALLAGFPPFGGPSRPPSFELRLRAHRETIPDPLDVHREMLPPELNLLVMRLLAKNPDDRFQHASELAAKLVPFCSDCRLSEWFSLQQFRRSEDDIPRSNSREKSSQSIRSPTVETSFDGRPPTTRRLPENALRHAPFAGSRFASFAVTGGSFAFMVVLGAIGVWISFRPASDLKEQSPVSAEKSATGEGELLEPKESSAASLEPRSLMDLSQTPPLSWVKVLEHKPIPVFWEAGQGLSNWQWAQEQQQLALMNDEVGLIGLGQCQESDFTLQTGIYQINWASGTGIFLGLQGWTPDNPDGPWTCYWFHVEEIRSPNAAPSYHASLTHVSSQLDDKSVRRFTLNSIASEPVAMPVGEVVLEVAIVDGTVSQVRFDGTSLQDLRRLANSAENLIDWRGGFGILMQKGNATVRNCQFMRTHAQR